MRAFVGIDLVREPVPDETTVCRFRHLLEAHQFGQLLFEEISRHLAAKGLRVATVDPRHVREVHRIPERASQHQRLSSGRTEAIPSARA